MQPRHYQTAAVNAARQAFSVGHKKVLVVAPTSSGKAMMIAMVAASAVAKGSRVLSLVHTSEILFQNEATLNKIAPGIPTGIYCAGTGRKEKGAQVTFASRDSLANDPTACGDFELVVIDEAHMVDAREGTQYQRILAALNWKYILSFTGTPWRLGGGNIWGPKGFFDHLAYNIGLDLLIKEGFVSPYVYPTVDKIIDASALKTASTGDFKTADLDAISSTEAAVTAALDAWERLAENRRVSIFFCCSIAHAKLTTDLLRSRGIETGYIDGETKDRTTLIDAARRGDYRAIVNVGVLTTGVDIPIIDCVVMLRATASAALYIQSVGRGLRKYPGKENLLILDFTDNVDRFGADLGRPRVKTKEPWPEGTGGGEMPQKTCPSCTTEQAIAAKTCLYCGHIFISHVKTPFGALVDGWAAVESYRYYRATTAKGEACMIVEWYLGRARPLKQWLLYERDGYVGKVARATLATLNATRVTHVKVENPSDDFPKIASFRLDKTAAAIAEEQADGPSYQLQAKGQTW